MYRSYFVSQIENLFLSIDELRSFTFTDKTDTFGLAWQYIITYTLYVYELCILFFFFLIII